MLEAVSKHDDRDDGDRDHARHATQSALGLVRLLVAVDDSVNGRLAERLAGLIARMVTAATSPIG